MMKLSSIVLLCYLLVIILPKRSVGFLTTSKPWRSSSSCPWLYSAENLHLQNQKTTLFLFRKFFPKNNSDEKNEVDTFNIVMEQEKRTSLTNTTNATTDEDSIQENIKSSKKISMPFFAKLVRQQKQVVEKDDENQIESGTSYSSNTNILEEIPSVIVVPPPTPPQIQLSPVEQAYALKAQAERTRLEAEKLDILLTIEKIDKLEKQLATKSVRDDPSKSKGVQRQIQALKVKLDGGVNNTTSSSTRSSSTSTDGVSENSLSEESSLLKKKDLNTVLESVVAQTKAKNTEQDTDTDHKTTLSSSETEARGRSLNNAPPFMKDLVLKANGIQPVENSKYNATELILQMYQDEKQFNETNKIAMDKKYNKAPVPEFTQEQIDEVLEAVRMVPQFIKNMYGEEYKNNNTAIALMMLEEEWREGRLAQIPEITQQMINDKMEEIKWIPQFLKGDNDTELAIELIKSDYRRNGRIVKQSQIGDDDLDDQESDSDESSSSNSSPIGNRRGLFGFGGGEEKTDKENMVEALFPQSTRKEGQEVNESLVKTCMSDILKDDVWMATAPPEKVPGGFIIRGKSKYSKGKELIDAVDKHMDKSKLKNQLSIFYVFDPTPVTKEQLDGGVERSPVLYVTGPDVARDPAPVQRSLISAVAFGTAWYNALLPFLLNDKFMKLADEQLALADASMSADLDFLNDLSFPLFAATIAIQASHELAHFITAQAYGMNITIPTLVPSLATGLTGAITSLKAPPKDKQALFDFAISGPLVGMAVSVFMLYVGMSLTVTMDAGAYSNLPALPLTLLRQSSLVGGILDSISPGLLTVPDAALGSRALNSINIPLHPLAIAGYFGMLINAANLLPTGSKYAFFYFNLLFSFGKHTHSLHF